MTDELDRLRRNRPDPAPDASTVDRHRAQLQDAIGGRPAASVTPPDAEVPAVAVLTDATPLPGRPRARTLTAVAAAAAVVVAVVGAFALGPDDGDDVSSFAGPGGPTALPTAGDDALRCGADLPASVEVPGAEKGPTAGPVPGGDPADDGQLVVHWAGPDRTVELRWPASPPPTYDLDPALPDSNGSVMTSGDRISILAGSFAPDDDTAPARRAGDVILDTAGHPTPGDECRNVEVRVTTPDGSTQTGIDLADLSTHVSLLPLITAQDAVEAAPAAVVECDGGAPNQGGSVNVGLAAEPAEALAAFLATPPAERLAPGGYTELQEADGTITYAKAIDGGSGYATLISVVPSGDGWTVDSWAASGC